MPLDIIQRHQHSKGLREKINFLNELYILYCCLTSPVTMIATLSQGVKYLVPNSYTVFSLGLGGLKPQLHILIEKKS